MANIGVFCSSLEGKKKFSELAHNLGVRIAETDSSLVYGGGKLGLMGIIANAVKKNDSKVISVIPHYLNKSSITFADSDEIHETKDLFERKKKLVHYSDILVALPGGVGTIDEIFDVIALFALGETEKPIFLLNVDNFWDPLIKLLNHLRKNKMIRPSNDKFIEARSLNNLFVVETLDELFSHTEFKFN
ncbi:MAG: TIGR00730 family Rossman fold protein [Pseudomonadota bacterium]|nr:TIGR00730 family Rossman fold protein [Pseudomonadota bacterium]